MNKNFWKILVAGASLLMVASASAGINSFNTKASASRIYEHVAAKSLHGNNGLWLRYGSNVHIKGILPGAYKVIIPGHRGEWIIPDLHDGAKQSKSYIRSLNFGHHRRSRRHYHRHMMKRHARRHSKRRGRHSHHRY